MDSARILIIDQLQAGIKAQLEQLGFDVDELPTIQPHEVVGRIADYQGLILRSKMPLDTSFFQKATKLRWVARAGAGLETIDLQAAAQHSVSVFGVPEANCDAVGEHALALLLNLSNKISVADQQVRQKIWDREGNRGWEIAGKTIGIIGYGNMGKAFAKKISGLGCQVIAYDKYNPDFDSPFAQAVNLQTLQASADIVSFHVPDLPCTRGYLSEKFIETMAKPFVLLNTSRGVVAPFEALRTGLESKKIMAAGLDVLENERFSTYLPEQISHFDWLAQQTNVLLTPHVAGWTNESYEKINQFLIQKIKTFYQNNS